MSDKIKIAIDAMGGEKSPKKIIDGIEISLKLNNENFFYIYGDEDLLKNCVAESRPCLVVASNIPPMFLSDSLPFIKP